MRLPIVAAALLALSASLYAGAKQGPDSRAAYGPRLEGFDYA
jgi:hypothetical protein